LQILANSNHEPVEHVFVTAKTEKRPITMTDTVRTLCALILQRSLALYKSCTYLLTYFLRSHIIAGVCRVDYDWRCW